MSKSINKHYLSGINFARKKFMTADPYTSDKVSNFTKGYLMKVWKSSVAKAEGKISKDNKGNPITHEKKEFYFGLADQIASILWLKDARKEKY